MSHLKIGQLRNNGTPDIEALKKRLKEQKTELSQLCVQKGSSAAQSKLCKIRVLKKNIARILTVLSQTKRQEVRKMYSGSNSKRVRDSMPKSLRPKLTHRRRLALTKKEKSIKTSRQLKRESKHPMRKFAIKL